MRWGGTVWIQLNFPVCSPVRRTVSSAGALKMIRSMYGWLGRKYLSQRSRVTWSSFTHSTNLYGPVPMGKSFGSLACSAFSFTISVAWASVASIGPQGLFR